MKTLKKYLLCIIGMLCTVSTWAYDFESDGIYYNIISMENLEVEVTEGDYRYNGDIVLPETVFFRGREFKVTTIGEYAFKQCYITSIDLKNVQTIDQFGFVYSSGLTSIDLKNVKNIGQRAFRECKDLVSIDLKNVQSLGSGVFEKNRKISVIKTSEKNPPIIADNVFEQITFLDAILQVPEGSKGFYQKATTWENFVSIVEVGEADKIALYVSCSEGGRVAFSNNSVTDSYTTELFNQGTQINLTFIPNYGYDLKSVVVNDVDVTEDVKENSYMVRMDTKKNVVVTFEKLPIFLTVQLSDNGNAKLLCEEGKSYEFVLTAAEGWKINTVTFNNVDVTKELDEDQKYITPAITENSTLNVSFELETPSAVQELSASHVSICGYNGNIVVEGSNHGDEIKVYAIDGSMIASMLSNGSNVQINVEENQVYVVKVGQRTFKLSL